MQTINIGDSDEKADWLKLVDGGKWKRKEQAIFDAQQEAYAEKREEQSDAPPAPPTDE